MNKKFTKLIAAVVLLTLLIPMRGWGQTRAEEVYKTALFGSSYNPNNSSYTGSFDATNGSFTVTVANFNNNNNGWTNGDGYGQIKCGRKNNASVATITTKAVIDKAITKVDITIDAVTAASINSVKLYTSSDNSSWTEEGSYTIATGVQSVSVTSPTEDLYYKVEFDCASGSSNGLLTLSKVEYYYNPGGGSAPTVSIPTTPIVVPSTGGSGNLDITYSNMDISEVDQFDVVFYDTDGTTPLPSSDYPTWVGQSFSGNDTDGYKFNYSISNYTGATDQVARLKVYALDDDYTTEAYSDLLTITQTTPPTYSVTYNANGGSGTMTDPSSPYFAGAEVTLLSNTFTAPEGKMFDSWLVKDADDDDVTVTAGKFTMPAKNVTVTAQWVVDPDAPQYEWVLTSIGDLTGSDVFVIVGTVSSTNYAMTNDNGTTSAPVASTVTIANGKLSDSPAANLRWNISGNSTDGYTFYPNGDDENWLYCNTEASSGSNNNLRVGTGGRKLFIAEGTTFKTKDDKTARFLNVYEGTPDWRGYTSNSTSTTTTFYKRQEKTTEPSLYAENVDIACEVTAGAITYTLENPVTGGVLTAAITAGNEGGWLTLGTVGETVPFTCTPNTGDARTATVTLTYTYNTSETKTATAVVTQSAINFATMPFAYDGDGSGTLPTGLTQSGVGTYTSSPAMKFDNTGDYLILKLNAAPTSLSYDIKGNTFSGGTFKVQTSANGTDYEDLATYTALGDKQTVTHIDLASKVRYIKWIYANKSSGNVALGNIKASANYDIYSDVTVASLTIPADKVCTVYSPATLNVTASLTNEATSEAWNNLVIKDGAQLKTPNAVKGTIEKFVAGYGESTNGNYVLLATPATLDACNSTGMWPSETAQHVNVDFYAFDQSFAGAEWRNYKYGNTYFAGPFAMTQGTGYLYANKNDVTLTLETRGYVSPNVDWQDHPFARTNVNQSVTLEYSDGKPFAGFNLIGNPFTCDAYINRDYYRMNDAGDAIIAATSATTAIKPCEGIFVLAADGDDNSVTFSTTVPSGAAPANVVINLKESEMVRDRAIVSFGNERNMPRFQFNEAAAKLYIPQGEKEMAKVNSEAQGEMPVNFKAEKNGSYTLSIDIEADMDYLHLIDNMTGADVDLLANPSYTFDARTSDYASRFRLLFSANTVDDNTSTGSATFAYFNGSEWVVNSNGNATLQVVDVMGRVLSSETVNGNHTMNLNLSTGVYMLRLVNGNDVKTQKIVVR